MAIFDALRIAASGMAAQRKAMDIIAENIANANTTHTISGEPYRRKIAVFAAKPISTPTDEDGFELASFEDEMENALEGVEVAQVREDNAPFRKVYDPTHPDADENGYVYLPNVNIITEMTNMIQASRAYEANVTVIESVKSMASAAMKVLQ